MGRLTSLWLVFFCTLISTSLTGNDTLQLHINRYISSAKYDSAKVYIEEKIIDIEHQEDLGLLYYQLVKVQFIQSDYDAALKNAFYALDHIDISKQENVNLNFLVGCIYSAVKDYGQSIDYFDSVVDNSQDSSLLVKAHLLLHDFHLELKDSTNARKSLAEAYSITNQANVDPKIKSHVSIQYNYFNQNYELCKMQNLAIVNDSTSFINSKSYAYSMIGDCLIQQDSLLESIQYLDEFLNLTFETNDPEQIKVAAKKLIDVYEAIGIQGKANTYHKIYNEAVSDSMSFSIENYRDLHNVEKNRILSTKSKSLEKYLLLGVIAVSLLSLGSFFLFRNREDKVDQMVNKSDKSQRKQIVISDAEIEKINTAIESLIAKQLFLTSKISRKSFCIENDIKSERYLSHFVNTEYKQSFTVFLNNLRVEYAYNRIHNDSVFRNFRIEEIAKDSGFGSKKSFERAFLAKYNETPYKVILKATD